MNDKNASRRIVIAGGSGFVGVSLAHHLAAAGFEIVILSRHAPKTSGPWRHVAWDARTLGPWQAALDGARALVNLVGRSVDCIKTPAHQDEILRSRVESTHVLGQATRAVDAPPDVWVQMSTGHIYGDPPEVVCTEDSSTGCGFAPLVGRAWEAAFHSSVLPSQRGVILRTSFVLGRDRGAGSGALARLKKLVRFGLGGRVASGKQGMSWIHEHDLNRLIERAIDDASMHGVYLATAPHPVPQSTFMRELRRAMHVPIGLPAYAWMTRIGAPLLMRTDPELALYGRYLVSRRLREEGFEFRYPALREALAELCSPGPPSRSLQHPTPAISATSPKRERGSLAESEAV
ncbi:MAG: epimerase [Planctomycetota bacterium]|nr:MAG: epimerase [Planctomycetota bacterium]